MGLSQSAPVFDMGWRMVTGVFNAPSPTHRAAGQRRRADSVLRCTLDPASAFTWGLSVSQRAGFSFFHVGHFRLGIQIASSWAGGRSSGSWRAWKGGSLGECAVFLLGKLSGFAGSWLCARQAGLAVGHTSILQIFGRKFGVEALQELRGTCRSGGWRVAACSEACAQSCLLVFLDLST